MSPQKRLGAALDIGTTTVRGSLFDLEKKTALSGFSCVNEQLPYGGDIISRIKFSLENKNGIEKLQKKAASSVNYVIKNLVRAAKKDKKDLALIIAVGNTASYHFMLSLSPKKLIEPPYRPEYKDFAVRKAASLGIEAGKGCDFVFLPNVGGFVGSDAIAVMLSSGLDRAEKTALAVDIGTNGEIILGNKDKIWVSSTAAGPAFEGWHISCGMRATKGAIESVEDEKGDLKIGIIGGARPKGISGSGIIDIAAILIRRGILNSSGNINEDFVLFDNHKKIFISKKDIREIQLAKAAFAAGVKFLRGLSKDKIEKFFVTGDFGSRLNKENAKTVGIIPQDIESERVEFLRDGALRGAELFLKDRESVKKRIEDILNKTEHISLAQDKTFARAFTSSLKF